MKILYKILIGIALCIIVLVIGAISGGRVIETKYIVSNANTKSDITIAQVSDFHSSSDAEDINSAIEIIKQNDVDYILLTGDILESSEMDSTIDFVAELSKISTVLYSRGNHDNDYFSYNEFVAKLKELDVIVLENESYQIDNLNFIGLLDNDYALLSKNTEYINWISDSGINDLYKEGMINILLAHRPSFLEEYATGNFDYVFSGHAHGGQWQIPFTDIGLLAPDDGFFTSNVHGMKKVDNTIQFINSGTSNPYANIGIPRLFNPMEVVIVTITSEE